MALQPSPEQPKLAALLAKTVASFPETFQPFVKTQSDSTDRVFRQSLYTVFSAGDFDQTSLVSELLAMAATLNPPFFKPAAPSVSDIAFNHAKAYTAQFLTLQAHQQLPATTNERLDPYLTAFFEGNIKRLELNFNQRQKIAGYLRDVKARQGQLASMASLLGALTSHQTDMVCDLASELGEALGTAVCILMDVAETTSLTAFRERLMTGHYGLPLLFGIENEPQFFTALFQQPHKPSDDQIKTAQALALQAGRQPATDMALELISQSELDGATLADGEVKQRLTKLLQTLRESANGKTN